MARAINKSDPFGIPKILEEAEERIRNYYTADEKKAKIREVVKETCRKNNIKIDELYYGSEGVMFHSHVRRQPIFLLKILE
jgi:hypothetical protein